MLRLAVGVLLTTVAALLVHEHGHLLAARSLGLHAVSIHLGDGTPWLCWQLAGVSYSIGRRFWAFGTLRYAGVPGGPWREAWLVSAGSVANAGAAVLAWPWAGGLVMNLLALRPLSTAQLWVLWNLAVGAVSLLPRRRHDGLPSDGLCLWQLLRGTVPALGKSRPDR